MASLYAGFRVLRLVDVFLFFSLRPSHIRDTFTYGSEKRSDVGITADDTDTLFYCSAAQRPPEAPVMSMALRFLALMMVMVSLPAVGR